MTLPLFSTCEEFSFDERELGVCVHLQTSNSEGFECLSSPSCHAGHLLVLHG